MNARAVLAYGILLNEDLEDKIEDIGETICDFDLDIAYLDSEGAHKVLACTETSVFWGECAGIANIVNQIPESDSLEKFIHDYSIKEKPNWYMGVLFD